MLYMFCIERCAHTAGMRLTSGGTQMMSGASHFIQRITLSNLPLPKSRGLLQRCLSGTIDSILSSLRISPPASAPEDVDEIQRSRQILDRRNDIIIMEHMRHGSVDDLVRKLRRKGDDARLSNRTLWLIFECLFKGCVAMAFPTSFWTRGRHPLVDTMDEVDESIPDDFVGTGSDDQPLVHFDLDPQNGESLLEYIAQQCGPDQIFPQPS